jgi:ADP-heptose:LPS heptosyltransferase
LINLAGKTTLRETFALYQRIQLLLTVDSSPIHLAAAAGVPNIVGVFGPTNHKQWGPHGEGIQFKPVFMDLPCRPCYAKVCEHNNCKVQLTGNQIAKAVKDLKL